MTYTLPTAAELDSDPLTSFSLLRERQPLAWHEEMEAWYVTRYADVSTLLKDDRLSSRKRAVVFESPELEAANQFVREMNHRWLMTRDIPDHTHARRTVVQALRMQQQLVGSTGSTGSIFDRARSDVGTDVPDAALTAALVDQALSQSLASLVGLELDQYRQILDCCDIIMQWFASASFDHDLLIRVDQAYRSLVSIVSSLVEAGDSAWAQSLRAEIVKGSLSIEDAAAFYAQVITGAIEPTLAIYAFSMEMLATNLHDWQAYAEHPKLFVNEMARLSTPFHLAPRTALTDIEMYGRSISEGERVVLVLLAANHDPRQFRNPGIADPHRESAHHLTFGRGRHGCIGNRIAVDLVSDLLKHSIELSGGSIPATKGRWAISAGMRRWIRPDPLCC